jgi:hypothetical protein
MQNPTTMIRDSGLFVNKSFRKPQKNHWFDNPDQLERTGFPGMESIAP